MLIEFLVIVFHCPQTTALPNAFLFYIIPSYRVVSLEEARHRWLGLNDSVAISYLLGFFLLFRSGGVYLVGTHDGLWDEDRKNWFIFMTDEVTEVLNIYPAVWPFPLVDNKQCSQSSPSVFSL